jgi:hypothetical protein
METASSSSIVDTCFDFEASPLSNQVSYVVFDRQTAAKLQGNMSEVAAGLALEMIIQIAQSSNGLDFRRLTVTHQNYRYVFTFDNTHVYACLVQI